MVHRRSLHAHVTSLGLNSRGVCRFCCRAVSRRAQTFCILGNANISRERNDPKSWEHKHTYHDMLLKWRYSGGVLREKLRARCRICAEKQKYSDIPRTFAVLMSSVFSCPTTLTL